MTKSRKELAMDYAALQHDELLRQTVIRQCMNTGSCI